MTTYHIGIDTGGTYTDAVLINGDDNEVVATAKTPTTHHNLSLGVSTSLRQLFRKSATTPNAVQSVAVSTSLATNTVVEGKGADVALLVAGPVKNFRRLPVVSTSFLKGGHNHIGEEAEKLDLEKLVDAVRHFKGHVDAYAVCAAMSIVNPTHEKVMEKAISLIDPKPVFCSHEVSDRPGLHERAATCVLNARLMPVMEEFLRRMQDSLVSLQLAGKVYIIRGDATPMDISQTHKQAASTVASGPAATAWYGLSYSPRPDAIIVDVGGTTTDITIIREGKPLLDRQGTLIGEWQTHIDAVKMSTVGAGGDSHAFINRNDGLSVGPARVLPLAMAEGAPPPADWLGREAKGKCVMVAPDLEREEVTPDRVLTFLMEQGPSSPETIGRHCDMAPITVNSHLKALSQLQLIVETGFTPTDALHVLGRLELGNREASRQGAGVLAAEMGMSPEEFCQRVLDKVEQKIEDAVLDHILKIQTGKTLSGFYPDYRQSDLLDLHFSTKLPIIGIGAAARFLLPRVAERLKTELVCPNHYEVGNALGAVLMIRS